jgi:hypothetical protein
MPGAIVKRPTGWTLAVCSKVIEAFLPLAAEQYMRDGRHPPVLLFFLRGMTEPVAVRVPYFDRETKVKSFHIARSRARKAFFPNGPSPEAVALVTEIWTSEVREGEGEHLPGDDDARDEALSVLLKCPEGVCTWVSRLERNIDEARLQSWEGPFPIEGVDDPFLALLGEVSRES